MSRKIAIGSTDGVNIDTHFGKTEIFYIYEIPDDGEPALVEKCFAKNHTDSGDCADFDGIIEKLSDVEIVLVRQIGDHAARLLTAKGIASASIEGSVERAIKRYAKRGKLLSPLTLEHQVHNDEYSTKREDCPMRAIKNSLIQLEALNRRI
jgi:predicted Fe-Mo cluster-binding NifX family protein